MTRTSTTVYPLYYDVPATTHYPGTYPHHVRVHHPGTCPVQWDSRTVGPPRLSKNDKIGDKWVLSKPRVSVQTDTRNIPDVTVLHHCTAPLYCTTDRHHCTAPLTGTTVLHRHSHHHCTAPSQPPLYCTVTTTVLHRHNHHCTTPSLTPLYYTVTDTTVLHRY